MREECRLVTVGIVQGNLPIIRIAVEGRENHIICQGVNALVHPREGILVTDRDRVQLSVVDKNRSEPSGFGTSTTNEAFSLVAGSMTPDWSIFSTLVVSACRAFGPARYG
jgi:hypothetical protein